MPMINGCVRSRWILALAAAGVIVFGYPGLMAYDSCDQLDQARRWDLGDWHPPVMSALWRLVEVFIAGPFGMFALQVVGFVLGAYWILRHEIAPRRAAIAVTVIAWLPPILTVMAVVWKDAQMAAYLLLGIAGLLATKRRWRYLGIAALVLASAMRHNAAAATLVPMVLLWSGAPQRWRRVLVGAGVWLAITVASFAINQLLVETPQHPWTISIATTDVVGTVRYAPPLSDAELRETLAGAPLLVDHDIQAAMIKRYDPRSWAIYYQFEPPLGRPATEVEHDAIARAWLSVVSAHPLAYLRHRIEVFRRVIHFGGKARVPILTLEFTNDGDPALRERLAHRASPSTFQSALFWLVRRLGGIWYVAYIYIVVALCLLPLARRHRLALALLGSGLCYELSLLFVAPSPDYRYSQWLMVTTGLAAVLVFARRYYGPGRAMPTSSDSARGPSPISP